MAGNDGSFLSELKRRNVYRVGLAYIVASWALLQVIDVVEPIIGMPGWVAKLILVLAAVGLPLVLVFAWAYEMTPEGLKREKDVDRSQSITPETGRRLDRIIVGVLAIAVVLMALDQYVFHGDEASPVAATASAGEAPAAGQEVTATSVAPSIAVLPFANMSADESSAYFSDGLADTLLHMLAQIREIRVAARTSSFQFRDQNTDITKIAEALNVGTILEGSVQRAGNKIRVTAQLIEADSGFHLWSGNFDRNLDDVFAIQDEIASEVVAALKVSLLGESAEKLTKHGTDNVEAYTEYLMAINDVSKYTFDSMRRGEKRFLNAVALDPDFAMAWARLGDLYLRLDAFGAGDAREMNDKAQDAASKALELQPDSAVAISVLASVELNRGNADMAEQLFLRAIELGPNEATPRAGLAQALARRNEFTESVRRVEEALALDPLSVALHYRAVGAYRNLRNYDEALEHINRMREIQPDSPVPWYGEGYVEFERGNWARALLAFERAHELDPDDPELAVQIGDYYLSLKMPGEARHWYDRAAEIDAAHPVSRSAPLNLLLYETHGSREAAALARQLLDERIAARKGSHYLVFHALWGDAAMRGGWDEVLELLRDHFPAYFDPDGDWSEQDDSTTWSVGAILHAAGRREQAMRILQPILDDGAEYRRKVGRRDGYIWDLAATGQRDELIEELARTDDVSSLGMVWPVAIANFPGFDFVRDEPEFKALLALLEAKAAEQRQELARLQAKNES